MTFDSDSDAWVQLGDNFIDNVGIIQPKPGYYPSAEDYDAINYLIVEWDYGYEGP